MGFGVELKVYILTVLITDHTALRRCLASLSFSFYIRKMKVSINLTGSVWIRQDSPKNRLSKL